MTKILFVCHGNICRSPIAEFVMKNLVKKAGLEDQFQISPSDVADPWYTDDFDATWWDMLEGCQGLLKSCVSG